MHKRLARALTALAFSLVSFEGHTQEQGTTTVVGSFTWREAAPWFGGISALELNENGTEFIALSDKGRALSGKISRDPEGRIEAIKIEASSTLCDRNGKPLNRGNLDAEGLALLQDGSFVVSFEGNHRLARYADISSPSDLIQKGSFIGELQSNSGMEALAVDPTGALWTLPERSGGLSTPFPVWAFDGTNWKTRFEISRSDGFLPVGADFDADGRLYILERRFSGFGFASRLRRFSPPRTGTQDGETLFQSSTGSHDNLEGLAIWQDAGGSFRATLVADDNFHILQRTELLDLILPN